jgi:hypothetical protein
LPGFRSGAALKCPSGNLLMFSTFHIY